MRPRLLLASMDVPGIGGLSTACYDLFRQILGDGHDAYLLNLIRERDVALFERRFGAIAGNPAGVPNVGNCRLGSEPADPQSALAARIAAIDPDIVVAFGHVAARLVKGAAPERRSVFMTGTCRQAQDYVTQGLASDAVTLASDLARGRISPRIVHRDEQHAVAICDLVVTNSALTLAMVERFYATSLGKVYPTVVSKAEWICNGAGPWRGRARPFTDRDIDVCFVASNWARPEKNYRWVAAIATTLPAATIHVVGDVPRCIPGVTHHGFLASRATLFDLLGRTRCVTSVSRMDAAPGVLFEASVLGCNVVTSKNCGNWELCHPELLVEPFHLTGFTRSISRAVREKYADRLDVFLAKNSYADLVALLHAFSRPFASVAAENE